MAHFFRGDIAVTTCRGSRACAVATARCSWSDSTSPALIRDSLKTRMDRAEDAMLPHTDRQSRLTRPISALP
eukprot:scaffold32116_cov64-Phaeocystis_antarctica.AAC.6